MNRRHATIIRKSEFTACMLRVATSFTLGILFVLVVDALLRIN